MRVDVNERVEAAWPVVAGAAGVLMVVQVVVEAIADLSIGASMWPLLLCISAAIALVVGMWRRQSHLLFVLAPSLCVLSLAVLSDDGKQHIWQPGRWILFSVTVLVFVAAAGVWWSHLVEADSEAEVRPERKKAADQAARGFLEWRAGAALLLLAIPVTDAALFAPVGTSSEIALPARALVTLIMAFVWLTVLYSFFITPMLNLDAEVRTLRMNLRAQRRPATIRRLRMELAAMAVIGVVCAIVLAVVG